MSEQVKTVRTLVGRVVSNKMQKTINVLIERKILHPTYGKYVKHRTKLLAHSELQCEIGDLVKIEESRPLSRRKNWRLVDIIEKISEQAK